MDSKRRCTTNGLEPQLKIRKIVHMSPEVGELLRNKDAGVSRLRVRHEGDDVYLYLAPEPVPVPLPAPIPIIHIVPNVPHNGARPKPLRPAGR